MAHSWSFGAAVDFVNNFRNSGSLIRQRALPWPASSWEGPVGDATGVARSSEGLSSSLRKFPSCHSCCEFKRLRSGRSEMSISELGAPLRKSSNCRLCTGLRGPSPGTIVRSSSPSAVVSWGVSGRLRCRDGQPSSSTKTNGSGRAGGLTFESAIGLDDDDRVPTTSVASSPSTPCLEARSEDELGSCPSGSTGVESPSREASKRCSRASLLVCLGAILGAGCINESKESITASSNESSNDLGHGRCVSGSGDLVASISTPAALVLLALGAGAGARIAASKPCIRGRLQRPPPPAATRNKQIQTDICSPFEAQVHAIQDTCAQTKDEARTARG